MTFVEAEKRVAEIKWASGDDEAAHSMEDRLREDFIRYIADNPITYGMLAKTAAVVLSTNDIRFARWCA